MVNDSLRQSQLDCIYHAMAEHLHVENGHHDPHRFLGIHSLDAEHKVIRLWRPGASCCHLEVQGKIVEGCSVHPSGLFEYRVSSDSTFLDYRIFHQNGLLAHDPYAFYPTLGELDFYLFSKGVHYELYHALGARILHHQGVLGTKFAVWAPDAKRVSLIGDFNYWDGRVNPMRNLGYSGIWEIFVPGIVENEKYKFEIHTKEGVRKVKSDPYAYGYELRPLTASVVRNVDNFSWTDEKWMDERIKFRQGNVPMAIYEVHLGSWRKKQGGFYNYREIAPMLASYCLDMGFTHVELMPIAEHPLDESWGYQVTGYFAVTSRYGSPEDFQFFVNYLHENNIGVLVDWVPAHFPTDDFSLAHFDGSNLYEHADPRQGFHPHWNTFIFNYGRHEVANFLIASALFWFEKMHIDGLRVDAVASMIYLDYGRKEGEWIPNIFGNNFNLQAIEFLKHLNSIVHQKFPGALMFAEESTAYDGVTRSLEWGGLGFDLKWNMGWMNDTLCYFSTDPIFRSYHQNLLTFIMLYAYTERFLLVLSHDEVVHGKGNLISKMPGDDWQKFASVRLLYSYMICQPGKKLLFMGSEMGQWSEWNCNEELHWYLCAFDRHQKLQKSIKDLNHFYLKSPALWERDFDYHGFEWIDFSDHKNSVISYLRKGSQQLLVCVHNFTPTYFPEYQICLPNVKKVKEVFNTDREEYWGSGKINSQLKIISSGFIIQLSPLATMIFEIEC